MLKLLGFRFVYCIGINKPRFETLNDIEVTKWKGYDNIHVP